MHTTHKVALALAALTLSLAGAPAAMAQGYGQPVSVDIQVDPRIDDVTVDVQVGSAPQPEPVYQPPVEREDVHESGWERHTTREYARP